MTRSRRGIALSLVAWLAIGLFWFVATRQAHPTLALAITTTTSLITAYALASYANQLALIPRFWAAGRYLAYGSRLILVMALLNGVALAVIRTAYLRTLGPDPDPNGLSRHYAIDFAGMIVHVAGAALLARLVRVKSRSAARRETA